eukprot:NODE_1329_length_625_cov_302.473958_g1045_i0.p1 GENE.NODE_1329_length_625_cov_302.473958_g1045_i0~~NODE_1329_length_625_cov_302.473958_g1045_i0.p1  ORF type:complete len:164 (+),score=13.26 NODE_1329_length_625_cov_302.473958_g1045_i0:26-493(+)
MGREEDCQVRQKGRARARVSRSIYELCCFGIKSGQRVEVILLRLRVNRESVYRCGRFFSLFLFVLAFSRFYFFAFLFQKRKYVFAGVVESLNGQVLVRFSHSPGNRLLANLSANPSQLLRNFFIFWFNPHVVVTFISFCHYFIRLTDSSRPPNML